MFCITNLYKKFGVFVSKFKPEISENLDFAKEEAGSLDLKNKLHEVCLEIERTKQWFEMETDRNLIDASIHQLMTLNAKYKYLISKLK